MHFVKSYPIYDDEFRGVEYGLAFYIRISSIVTMVEVELDDVQGVRVEVAGVGEPNNGGSYFIPGVTIATLLKQFGEVKDEPTH